MIITRTTPVNKIYDSYTVEIETMIGDADGYSNLTVGPFKRVEHWENLTSLLTLLTEMKKDSFIERYTHIVGFLQWFNPEVKTLDGLTGYDHYFRYLEEDEEKEHETILSLARGFTQEWPYDPRTDEGYHQILANFKVFYYDYTGTKYHTEVTME